MKKINKILVATDFSKEAETAYPTSQKIASSFGATVDFIHVIPSMKYINESMKKIGVPLDMDEDIYPRLIEEAEHQCKRAMDSYLPKSIKGRHVVKVERKPSMAIVQHARDEGYDLIIMAARGGHGTRLLRGGTTEKVIRRSVVPVFSVDSSFDEAGVNRVLVPTDLSEHSFEALPLASLLALTYDAELTLLHVIELYGSPEELPYLPGENRNESIYHQLTDRLEKHLEKTGTEEIRIRRTGASYEDLLVISGPDGERTIPMRTQIVKGVSAHYEIENYAEENADVVVIATHGHSGFAHLILGSTSEKVAQYSSKPIITVRPPSLKKG